MGSSAKGGGGSKSYNYYGTLAALVSDGPVDELYGIELEDELKWSGSLRADTSPNPVQVSVPDYGNLLFFWGTDDQQTPAVLTAPNNTLAHDHPAYVNKSYAVLLDFLFGQERESAPTIRFYVRRRPRQNLVAGPAAMLTDGQANPVAVIAEILTNPRGGLAWPESKIDRASFQRAADTVQARINLTGVSLVLDKQDEAKAVISDLLDLIDGYVRVNRETGLCEIIVFPQPEEIDQNALPLITSRELTAVPELDPDTWDDIPTRWRATYRDRDKNFKERSVKVDDPRARYAAGLKRPETLRCSMIVREEQARAYLAERARRLGVPGCTGTLSVRGARYATLRPGDHVRGDIDPQPGGEQIRQVFRVLEVTRRAKGELKVKLDAERTLAPELFIPIAEPAAPPPPPPAVADIASARLLECPPALADNENFAIAALVSRPGGMITNYTVYYDSNPGDLFPALGGARSFALRARLVNALDTNITDGVAQPVRVEILDQYGTEILDDNPGATAARDDTLLAFLIKSDASQGGQIKATAENKAWIEVLSCVEAIAVAEGVLEVSALRARCGTSARPFDAGDEVWFIRRDHLAVLTHADFEALAAANKPAYFKLQPGESARARPLEDCAPRTFSFALARDLPEIDAAWHLETRYRYQDLKPTAPPPVDIPDGWSLTRPTTGAGCLWATQARKRDANNKLYGTWSDPIRAEGRRVFYRTVLPTPGSDDIRDGDICFLTSDNNKTYRYDPTADPAWVPSFAPMLKFANGLVYGLQTADAGETEFVLVADAFQIWDGKSATCPFEIRNNQVYIKDALIEKIAAGKITSGQIEAANITLAGDTAIIQSADYQPGYSGWIIRGDGTAEFARVTIRDSLITGSLGALSLSPWFKQFDNNQLVYIAATSSEVAEIRYTIDGSHPNQTSLLWPTDATGFAPITLNGGARIRARGFSPDGRMTDEVDGIYLKNVPQVDTPAITIASVGAVHSSPSGAIGTVDTITYTSPTKKECYISCATPGRRIFFRVQGFAGAGWTLDTVAGPVQLSGTVNTGWYEWKESTTTVTGGLKGTTQTPTPAVTANDSAAVAMRVYAYAVVSGMTNSTTNLASSDFLNRLPAINDIAQL